MKFPLDKILVGKADHFHRDKPAHPLNDFTNIHPKEASVVGTLVGQQTTAYIASNQDSHSEAS